MTPTLADLRAHPHDRDRLLVYADWLQSQGDARGELIAVQDLAATSTDAQEFARARARARELVLRHGELCPPAAGHAGAPPQGVWATWERGFVRRLELLIEDPSPGDNRREFSSGPTGWAELLAAIMEHPSMALVEQLLVRVDLRGEPLDECVIAIDVAFRGLHRWTSAPGPRPPLRLDLWTQRVPGHDLRQRLRDRLPELHPSWFSTDVTELPPPAGHAVSALEQLLVLVDGEDQPPCDLLWFDDRGHFLARIDDARGGWQVHARRLAERWAGSILAVDEVLVERRVARLFDVLAARLEPREHPLAPRPAPQLERVDLSTALRRLAPLSTTIPHTVEPVLRELDMALGWYAVVEPCGEHRWCGVIGLDHHQLLALALIG